jgi:hypothetical protein
MVEPDFSGYATKAGLKCSDGRTITAEAFKHLDGATVPLVWQHIHDKVDNVLGHAILRWVPDGMRADGYFNETKQGQIAHDLVIHKDVKALSIYANQLVEQSKRVLHGEIRELSLVLAGANKGAFIDYVRIKHGDGDDSYVEERDNEAIISMMIEPDVIAHIDDSDDEESDEDLSHADGEERTVQDIYDGMTQEEKDVVAYLVGAALEENSAEHSGLGDADGDENNTDGNETEEGSGEMTHNIFEQNNSGGTTTAERHYLSHEDVKGIVQSAIRGGSLREAVEDYALQHNIGSIDVLFPDAKLLQDRPEFNKRRTEWVADVLDNTTHSPFSRVKTIVADITQEEARAKGYIKGNYKKNEWFGVSKRTTSPTTVYKKQDLDRDDVVDITDFDVVAWLKGEMRMMLEEEIARAILISDGRDVGDEDKIKDPIGAADGAGIRSIVNDHELFVTTLLVNVDDASSTFDEVTDVIMDGMEFYKGSGTPDFYTTIRTLNKWLQIKDTTGRRIYNTKAEVAAALGVRNIITVEPMNDVADLVGIIVNLADYNIGTDKGGEVSMFDDFDIDYNKMKYLIEARMSGALTKIKSALVIKKTTGTNVRVTPTTPTFVKSTGVVTIPTKTGVVYKDGAGTTLTAGAQTALAAGASLVVNAFAASGYYFQDNATDSWTFKRPAAQ